MWEATIALMIFMMGHLCGTIWWMSKIQTTLDMLVKTMQDSNDRAMREFTVRDNRLEAAWKAIDAINERCLERARSVTQVEVNTKRLDELEHRLNK